MATQGHAKAHSWTWGAQLDVNDHKGIIRFSAPPRGVTVPLRLLPSACSRQRTSDVRPQFLRFPGEALHDAPPNNRTPKGVVRDQFDTHRPLRKLRPLRKICRPQHPEAHGPLPTRELHCQPTKAQTTAKICRPSTRAFQNLNPCRNRPVQE